MALSCSSAPPSTNSATFWVIHWAGACRPRAGKHFYSRATNGGVVSPEQQFVQRLLAHLHEAVLNQHLQRVTREAWRVGAGASSTDRSAATRLSSHRPGVDPLLTQIPDDWTPDSWRSSSANLPKLHH
jgi:hypothetical protein